MLKLKKAKTEFEGRIQEELIVVEGEGLSSWDPQADLQYIGKSQPRLDGGERVTGQARYTHDIEIPGMLYGKILRSPHAHARIKKLETKRAEDLPGVRLVLTPGNIPRIPFFGSQTFLLDETARYVGDEVACVIADEEGLAEDALEEIEIEYEKLPFVLDPEEALKPEAPRVQPAGNLWRGASDVYERGDLRRGFAEAEVVVEGVFKTQSALHNSMETHGSVAFWQGDQLVVWDSTQHIFGVRQSLARLLNMDMAHVQVIKKYMGGGFGSKNFLWKYTLLAAIAARRTGRPVKILLSREEENLAAGNRPSGKQCLKIGARRDGALTAIDLKVWVAAGAYVYSALSVGGPARQLYACPNVRTEQFLVLTHTGPMAAFRAPGYVEGTFALESVMDELAEKLQLDPLDLRLKNYSESNPITGQAYSSKGLREAYQRGAQLMGWEKRRRGETGNKRRGFGMASQIWGGSGGPPAYAWVKINPDGSATIISGTQDIGTGTKTALAQIAAEELGLPLKRIAVEIGDTQTAPYAPISAGSMTLASIGPAVRVAAHDAREQLLEVASQVLQVPQGTLALGDGFFHSAALSRRVAVHDVLSYLKNFMVVGRGARGPNPDRLHVNTFGVQFAQVEVDTDTGEVKIEKMVAIHDSGRVINPLALSSQIEGGLLQGLGFGLMEERILDRATGGVVNGNLEDYKIPTALDVPPIELEMIDRPDPQANNLGVKGVGEPPIIPSAAAVANAVADALGTAIRELPLTRDKILQAWHRKKQGGGDTHAQL